MTRKNRAHIFESYIAMETNIQALSYFRLVVCTFCLRRVIIYWIWLIFLCTKQINSLCYGFCMLLRIVLCYYFVFQVINAFIANCVQLRFLSHFNLIECLGWCVQRAHCTLFTAPTNTKNQRDDRRCDNICVFGLTLVVGVADWFFQFSFSFFFSFSAHVS